MSNWEQLSHLESLNLHPVSKKFFNMQQKNNPKFFDLSALRIVIFLDTACDQLNSFYQQGVLVIALDTFQNNRSFFCMLIDEISNLFSNLVIIGWGKKATNLVSDHFIINSMGVLVISNYEIPLANSHVRDLIKANEHLGIHACKINFNIIK